MTAELITKFLENPTVSPYTGYNITDDDVVYRGLIKQAIHKLGEQETCKIISLNWDKHVSQIMRNCRFDGSDQTTTEIMGEFGAATRYSVDKLIQKYIINPMTDKLAREFLENPAVSPYTGCDITDDYITYRGLMEQAINRLGKLEALRVINSCWHIGR